LPIGSLLPKYLYAVFSERIILFFEEKIFIETEKIIDSNFQKDELLKDLVKKFHGYRISGQPDLFESLVWAVLGQQINLQFAYTLKQRFVQQFGERVTFDGVDHYLFPEPKLVATLGDDDLLPLQFSRQKSKYVKLIGEAFASGTVSKEKLSQLSFEEAKTELMMIKGIGNWTANYALMKTFRHPDAFPLEDAGVQIHAGNSREIHSSGEERQLRMCDGRIGNGGEPGFPHPAQHLLMSHLLPTGEGRDRNPYRIWRDLGLPS